MLVSDKIDFSEEAVAAMPGVHSGGAAEYFESQSDEFKAWLSQRISKDMPGYDFGKVMAMLRAEDAEATKWRNPALV